jgi:nicotinamidase-related amidase
VIAPLAPLADELVLPKSSSSPFNSTSLDYLLRNIGITELVVAGLLTDQCIDHTVKDAADRGYTVTCLIDACMAESAERHRAAASAAMGGCARWRSSSPPHLEAMPFKSSPCSRGCVGSHPVTESETKAGRG